MSGEGEKASKKCGTALRAGSGRKIAGGPPALRQAIRFSPAFQCPRSGGVVFLWIPSSRIPPTLFPSRFVSFVAGIPPAPHAKIFSNHWKMHEKFFQSLEKSRRFFQPLENFFPIVGKRAGRRRASRLCRGGRAFGADEKLKGGKVKSLRCAHGVGGNWEGRGREVRGVAGWRG